MEELNRFKDIQLTDMETESIVGAVSSLKHKVCAEVAEEAKELADISKQLQGEVLEKRQRVMQLLADLLLDSSTNEQTNKVSQDQALMVDESQDDGSEDDKLTPPIVDSYPDSARKDIDSIKNSTSQSKKKAAEILSVVLESSRSTATKREGLGEWTVAARVNNDRCKRCEDLDEEEVCGDNGKTYRTLCHAVNCGGLALRDISVGSCVLKVTTIA